MRRRQCGLSLIELLIAMGVLGVGMGGALILLLTAIGGNQRAKLDTQAVQVSQTVLEALSVVPADTTSNVTVRDCAGNAPAISTAAGGAALNANGDIDWTKTTSSSINFVSCGASGARTTYELRWRISSTGFTKVKLIDVSARLKNSPKDARMFSVPVTLHTMVGSQ